METQINLNDMTRKIMDRFDYADSRMLKLEEKVERMDMRITTSVDRLDRRIDDLNKTACERFEALEEKVHNIHIDLTNRIDELDNRLGQNTAEFKSLRSELSALSQKTEDRITHLETWRNSYSK